MHLQQGFYPYPYMGMQALGLWLQKRLPSPCTLSMRQLQHPPLIQSPILSCHHHMPTPLIPSHSLSVCVLKMLYGLPLSLARISYIRLQRCSLQAAMPPATCHYILPPRTASLYTLETWYPRPLQHQKALYQSLVLWQGPNTF
jgi:hypothetical protein